MEQTKFAEKGDPGLLSRLCPNPATGLLFALFPPMWCCACKQIRERQSGVFLSFGKYTASISEPGCYCFNSCGLEERKVNTAIGSFHLERAKVADSNGNPLVVSAVITYKIVAPAKAALDVPDYLEYIRNQGLAVMKRVVSMYPYEAPVGHHSLKTEASHVREMMVQNLQEKTLVAGVEVLSFDLTDLSYAPEIAQQMLVRQQAEAVLAARGIIARGGVMIAQQTVAELAEKGVTFTADEKARLVTNLLITVCGESKASPVIALA
jgi:regulator of protease activity HflC (stomatin/prohibitin superfamily)